MYYPYIICTLPVLNFNGALPISFENFLRYLERFLTADKMHYFRQLRIDGQYIPFSSQLTLRRWQEFDTALRNELVRLRSARYHAQPNAYLREENFSDVSTISHAAFRAFKQTSPLEAERILDEARWKFLDDLAVYHMLDLDALLLYGLKLLILERWQRIKEADKEAILNKLVTT